MDTGMEGSIVTLVDYAMGRFTDDNLMFHVVVDARMDFYGSDDTPEEDERHVSADIHFLFHRPSNYTKVFAAVEGCEYQDISAPGSKFPKWAWMRLDEEQRILGGQPQMLNELRWRMFSNHDSCWRSDGVGSVLHGIQQQMWLQMEDVERDRVHQHHSFSIFAKPKFVQADVIADPTDDPGRNYLKLPTNIREAFVVNCYQP